MDNMIGKVYGNLTVLEYCGTDKYHNKLYKCKWNFV